MTAHLCHVVTQIVPIKLNHLGNKMKIFRKEKCVNKPMSNLSLINYLPIGKNQKGKTRHRHLVSEIWEKGSSMTADWNLLEKCNSVFMEWKKQEAKWEVTGWIQTRYKNHTWGISVYALLAWVRKGKSQNQNAKIILKIKLSGDDQVVIERRGVILVCIKHIRNVPLRRFGF